MCIILYIILSSVVLDNKQIISLNMYVYIYTSSRGRDFVYFAHSWGSSVQQIGS